MKKIVAGIAVIILFGIYLNSRTSSVNDGNVAVESLKSFEPTETNIITTPAFSPATNSTKIENPSIDSYLVTKIIDGDTITIAKDGKPITIRLMGIDTPETVDPRKPVQCFGKEASDKTKELLAGKNVHLEYDPDQLLDKYGRMLAYVFLSDGTDVNKLLVKQGYAHEYTYSIPYKYQAEYKTAQLYAQENKNGLWADGICENLLLSSTELPTPVLVDTSKYDCSSNKYNCTDFKTHAEAQAVYDACGGVSNDIHKLDQDHDGEACESLP